MAILQPDGNTGEITLNVSAEGMKGASVTIRTVDRILVKQQGKDIVTPGSIWKDTDGNPINAHGEVFSTMKVLIIGMVNLKVIPLIAWIGLKPGSAGGLKPEGWLAIHPRI